jgi:hypothetical protein
MEAPLVLLRQVEVLVAVGVLVMLRDWQAVPAQVVKGIAAGTDMHQVLTMPLAVVAAKLLQEQTQL